MLKTHFRFLLTIMLLTGVAIGCGEEKVTKPQPLGLRLTPLPDAEAELAALWLSGEIEAPEDLYQRIHNDLAAIRSAAGHDPVLDSISFSMPWEIGILLFDLGLFGADELRNHQSPIWDSLNALYKPVLDSNYQRALFPGRLHPERLAESYARVSQISDGGVGIYAHATFGGWWLSQIIPGYLGGDTLVYLFQRGYTRQIMSAPDSVVFWCFYSAPGATWSAGRYTVDSTGAGETPPGWWADFCTHARRMNLSPREWCEGGPGVIPVRIVETPPASIGRDRFELRFASLSGNVLSVTVQYGGGCETHEFLLFMSPSGFLESAPVQANLYLMHEDNGDLCRALITETRRFDISPIARQYERFYGTPGDIKLNVFNFERAEFQQVLYRPD